MIKEARFCILFLFTYFDCCRFSDIPKLKWGDLSFDKDQNMVGFMRQSKTDHIRVGREFTISGREIGQFSTKKALQC